MLKSARFWSTRAVITQNGQNLPWAGEEIDLQGRLVVPPCVVEPHLHLDGAGLHPRLTGPKAMLEIREQLQAKVTLQIVAFLQEGMYACKAAAKWSRRP